MRNRTQRSWAPLCGRALTNLHDSSQIMKKLRDQTALERRMVLISRQRLVGLVCWSLPRVGLMSPETVLATHEETSVNDRYPAATVDTPLVESLAERMDLSIGEASTVMGSVLTELMRRALRGGIMQMGEQLQDFVGEKVVFSMIERTP